MQLVQFDVALAVHLMLLELFPEVRILNCTSLLV
jgi:hypothetical protein